MGEGFGSLDEFIFVFKSGVQALKVGPLPQDVGLLTDRHPLASLC
jgi:hypothetical protein